MATAGGASPNGASPKREITPEQKRTYIGLGVVGVLALVVGVMYLPGLLGGAGTTTIPTAPTTGAVGNTTANAAANSAVTTPTGSPDGGFPGGSGTPVGGTLVSTTPGSSSSPPVFISRSRIDPFQPVLLIPRPAPPPLPPDPSIEVVAPNGFDGTVVVPAISDPRLREAVAQPLNIGSPNIPRLETATAPRDAFPLPRDRSGEGGGAGAPQLSYDKRLAGVIIGDGVRALLELPSGEQRVVQPGDEVEGVRVLNIERFRQGDRTVSRMLIRDTDGSQKYVELKPSPNPPGNAAGGGLDGGSGSPLGGAPFGR